MDIIRQLVCKKNNISYITFDKNFKVREYNHTLKKLINAEGVLEVGSDIRHSMWEIVGLEEQLKNVLQSESDTLNFPMIMKNKEYYDLDIESFFNEKKEKLFIAYLIQKPQESLSYINMIKKINKHTLVYESENKKVKEQHFDLINQRLLSFNVDLNGIITSINPAFSHFFDTQDTQILGKHFSHYFKSRDLDLKSTSIIFNAINTQDEIISFHADIIPVSENGTIYENIIICQDISYLKRIEKELKFAAGHDALTGLANRSKLLKKMDDVIQKAKETKTNFSLCFIDLNKFKPVNDNYGHHAGDMLLKHIAKVLCDFVRKGDMVARIGGDEFIILYDTLTDEEYLSSIKERIQKLPELHPFIYTKEDIIEFGFSLGIASYPDDARTAQELLKVADKKMYLHKRAN
ncbi:MAG: diguanylate cyclase [Sulfurimonas sp.]|nr:diguanylate cyclase [Sulfurimonas sp.]